MAAVLTIEMGSTDKMVEYIEECRRMGLKVLPPDVNVSGTDFTPVEEGEEGTEAQLSKLGHEGTKGGTIRFGMCAVKGVGGKAIENVIAERDKGGAFRSIYDFCERIDTRVVQRSTVEALIKCGAFSSISPKRAPLLNVFDRAFEMGQQTQNDKRAGQMSIFGSPEASPLTASRPSDSLPNIDELPSQELLKFEKDLLGFYITSHPLTEHQTTLQRYSTATTREAMLMQENTEVMIGGMICRCDRKVAKSGKSQGKPWAILGIEDLEGKMEGMCYAEAYADIVARYPDALKIDSIVFVKGKVDRKRENPCLIINEVMPISEALPKLTTSAVLKLDAGHSGEQLRQIKQLLAKHKGNLPLFAQVETMENKVVLRLPKDMNVRPTMALVEEVDQVLGDGTVQLYGEGQRRLKRLQQQALFKESESAAAATEPSTASEEQILEQMDAEMLQEA
jgi:DNA polymerase-3 subunit alpha